MGSEKVLGNLSWESWKSPGFFVNKRVGILFIKAKTLFVVAVWSAVNVAGTRLRDLAPEIGTPDDMENWEQVHVDVINRSAFLYSLILSTEMKFSRKTPNVEL